jgi:hypothetical protein
MKKKLKLRARGKVSSGIFLRKTKSKEKNKKLLVKNMILRQQK